jgi:hypothetical protein
VVEDSLLWKHFGHLPELEGRRPGLPWRVQYATLPMDALSCPYPTPGEREAPPTGLMGSVGWKQGSAAYRLIIDMAQAIKTGLHFGTADTSNPALQKVLDLRERGEAFILRCEEPLAFVPGLDAWFVREGIHRTVALALLGATEWEAMNLSSLHQAAG